MLEWYVLSVIGFALGFDQHRSVLVSGASYPSYGFTPVLFEASAWVGGMATLIMLLAGSFFGTWWWPLLAMAIGTVTNYTGRQVIPIEYRYIVSMIGTFFGFGSVIIFFH